VEPSPAFVAMALVLQRPATGPATFPQPLARGVASSASASLFPGPRGATASVAFSCIALAAARGAGKGKKQKLAPSKFKPAGKFDLSQEKKKQAKKKKQELYEVQYEAGAIAPLYAWDPLGFVSKAGGESAMKESFFRLRCAELKHGRVAMLAVVGAITQHFVHLPIFDGQPLGIGALNNSAALFGFSLLFIISGYLEVVVLTQDDRVRAGSFGDPLGFAKMMNLEDGGDNLDMQNKELSNGRLAMIGIAAVAITEKLTGLDAGEQLGAMFRGA